MNESQFDLITLKSSEGSRRIHRMKQESSSSEDPTTYGTDDSSIRSTYLEMEDRELAHAIKRIEKLSAEIRASEDVEGHVRSLRDRIDTARRSAAIAISKLNDKMDAIEQAWDDQIIQEQKEIAKEVLSILKGLKEDELSQALTWRKKRRSKKSSASNSRTSSSRKSGSSAGSIVSSGSSGSRAHSSSMSKKIARLDKKEREFAGRASQVKKDARQIDAMSKNLDTINELERVVCNKLGRLQSVGDAKPGSAVYGTVELVDNYRATVEHLANAIRALNTVSCLPSITNEDPITKSEIDKVCGAMTEFLGRIKAQLGSNGPFAEIASRRQTSVRVAGKGSDRPASSSSATSESGATYKSAIGSSSSTSMSVSTADSIESYRG